MTVRMSQNQQLEEVLTRHPCYSRDAHREFARMHVPVAPCCNIQCNYCNRKYDCCNESRPGVTSEVLTPEQAAKKVAYTKSKIPNLSVVGIAGPGDPLANEETFHTLELVSRETPDLILCISTNGLALPGNAQRLYDLGVRFITVTMNACDPDVGAQIYGSVLWQGRSLKGRKAAKALIAHQTEGIERCAALGMLVKVNIVMIPGINDGHIPDLVRYVKGRGAYIVNILPLIPVDGTPFAKRKAPTPKERREMMDHCSLDARMMRHCRQCRADAIGLLDQDRSQEFVHFNSCGSGCGPSEPIPIGTRDPSLYAVATTDGVTVDSGFGNASVFRVYRSTPYGPAFIRDIHVDRSSPIAGGSHREHIRVIVESISDCGNVIVREIGDLPRKTLSNLAIRIVISDGAVSDAIVADVPGILSPVGPSSLPTDGAVGGIPSKI